MTSAETHPVEKEEPVWTAQVERVQPDTAAPEPEGFRPYDGGFTYAPGAAAAAEYSTPTPAPTNLPKRPKGRLFVGTLLVATLGFAGYQIWLAFFQYKAYGVVAGRTISVYPPWDGVIDSYHVDEGEKVEQGQLLAVARNVELEQQAAALEYELRIAQARLDAETSRLKAEAGWKAHQFQEGVAEYYDAWGELLAEKATLQRLELDFAMAAKLSNSRSVANQELEHTSLAYQGQKDKVAQLERRLLELKKRIDSSDAMTESITPQLKPLFAEIEAVAGRLKLVRERLNLGHLRATTDGLVIRRHRFAGERCPVTEPLLDVLERGSLEVVLYVRQGRGTRFAPGDTLDIDVEPHDYPIRCTVRRVGPGLLLPPAQIARYYWEAEPLLPVYLVPAPEFAKLAALRAGSVAKLPFRLRHKRD